MIQKVENIYKASTSLFLFLEQNFIEYSAILVHQSKFFIFVAQLLCLVTSKPEGKQLQYQSSVYVHQIIEFIAVYPTLQTINKITGNTINYIMSCFLILIIVFIIHVVYSNYKNNKRNQTIQLSYIDETISIKICLQTIFTLWIYVLLIPLIAVSIYSIELESNKTTQFNFNYLVSFINLILTFLITIYISLNLRKHQFYENIQIEDYSILNVLNCILIQILAVVANIKNGNQFLIGQQILFFSIIIINLYQGLFRFNFGYNKIQRIQIQLYITCLTFQMSYLIWYYSQMTDQLLFFIYLILLPFTFGISNNLYQDRMFEKLKGFIINFHDVKYANQALRYIHVIYKDNVEISKLYYRSKQNIQHELLLNSLFYQHQKVCSNTKCPVRLNRNSSIPITQSIIEKYTQYFYQTRIISLDLLKQDTQSYENIVITYLNYLIYKRNYLLAYKCCQQSKTLIETKGIQITDSYFFKATLQVVSNHCILKIYDKNLKLVTISQQQYQIQSDIINLLQIEDYYFQELYSQLLQYIKLFTDYQNQQFYSFEELLYQLNILYKSNNEIRKNINQNNNKNKDIKQFSLYLLRIEFIVNIITNDDYGYLLQLTQKLQKEELLLEENSKTFFNNNSFVGDSGISIIGNLLNGKLYNPHNKSIHKFFKYDPLVQLTKSEQLMPRELGIIHQGLIDRYLITGKSTRINNLSETFIQNSDGFLERSQIFFSNYFSQSNKSDLLLIVFLKKITEATQNSGVILVSEDLTIYGITEELFYFIYGQPSGPNTPTEEYAYEAGQFLKKMYNQNLEEISPTCCEYIRSNHQELTKSTNIKFNGFIMKYSPTQLVKNLKGFSSQNFLETQIQFQIQKKVYLPYIEGIEKPTIGYEIYIEFDEVSTGNYTTQQRIKLFKVPLLTLRSIKRNIYSEKTPQQTNRITSEYNETNKIKKANYETDLDLSSIGNQQIPSVNKIIGQVSKFNKILNSDKSTKSIKYLIVKILIKCLFLITFIILFACLNIEKNKAQTICIYESNFDIEYLDAYSQLFFGSRRILYNRDFYNASKDRIIEYNKSILNISRQDQIIYSHGNLLVALGRLDEKENDYSKMIQREGSQDMKVAFINSNYQIYYQEVHSRAEFNQVMYITFYWSFLTFASTPDNYLKGGTDPFIVIFTRSQLMYNFFTMAEFSADKVGECLDLTFEINDQIDTMAFIVFTFYYILFILLQTIATLFFIQAYKELKIYLKYFGLLNYYDLNLTIDYYEQIKDLIKIHQLCFSNYEFQQLVEKPQQQLHAIRLGNSMNSSSNKFPQNKIKKTLSYKKMILLIGLGFILIQFYGAFNQMYYNFQSQQITPIFLKAIQAEKIRLKYIISMSYWDFYCVRKFYLAYNSTKNQNTFWSTNIEQNMKILYNLNVSRLRVIQEIDDLKQSSISDLIISLEENLNIVNQEKLGYSDLCLLTGCNLDDLRDRPHFDNFISYFKQGVISLEKIVNKIFTDHSQLIEEVIEDQEYLIRYQQLQEDLDYFIIYQFGVDAFQIKMQQFSKYFLHLSSMKLNDVKQLNLFFVVFTGLIILFFYLITSIFFIQKLMYTVKVARVSLKYIPIQVIFKKKIDHQLISLERKNM